MASELLDRTTNDSGVLISGELEIIEFNKHGVVVVVVVWLMIVIMCVCY